MKNKIMPPKSIVLSMMGMVLFALPLFFLECTALSAVFCLAGLSCWLVSSRFAQTKSEIVIGGLCLWLGYGIRFCTLYGTSVLYNSLIVCCFIPYTAAIWGALLLAKKVAETKVSFLSVLVFPAFNALIALLMAEVNLGFFTNVMNYCMFIPAFAKCLAGLGEYGITFFFSLILTCATACITERKPIARIIYGGLAILMVAVPLVAGTMLSKAEKQPDYYLRVALATSQKMDFIEGSDTPYTLDEQIKLFESALQQAKQDDAQLLVLNEEFFYAYYEERATLYASISDLAKTYQIPVLAGIELIKTDDLWINEALYWNARGELEYTYVKNNLVPFAEAGDYVDGEENAPAFVTEIGGRSVNISYIICFDLNDEVYLRTIPATTELLLVPSWDWDTANIEQLRTFSRSSILQVTLLKHTYDGFSFVSTPYGEITELVDFRGLHETVKTVTVPLWEK